MERGGGLVIWPVIDSSRVAVSVFRLIKVIDRVFIFALCKCGACHRVKTKETE